MTAHDERRARAEKEHPRLFPGSMRTGSAKGPDLASEDYYAMRDVLGPDGIVKDVVGVPEPGSRDASDTRVRKAVRPIRLGKRWSEIIKNVDDGVYTWNEFVSSLTPTELARGMLMSKDGGFRGRPPSLVPRAFHDACVRELMNRGQVAYRTHYLDAIKAMTDIATNVNVKESDRIKAAQFVIERLEGKAVERVQVAVETPFESMMAGAVASLEEDVNIANAQQYLDRIQQENGQG